jgi:hypothetical protein
MWLLKGTLVGGAAFVIFLGCYIYAIEQRVHAVANLPPGAPVSIDLRGTGFLFSIVFAAMIVAACLCFRYWQQRAGA